MNVKNLERAGEIAKQLPVLEEARKALSNQATLVRIVPPQGKTIDLPHNTMYNILSVINAEINRLKEEVATL